MENILHVGDCLPWLRTIPDNYVDCLVTDPPYGINFMHVDFDKELPTKAIWEECYRILKPGAFAAIMTAPRSDKMWRVMNDIEESGFNISFSPILWVYPKGFPKIFSISKNIDKEAFKNWCNEIPDGETLSRASLMGWGEKEISYAASVAICGFDETYYMPQRKVDGARLLKDIQERFGPAPGVRKVIGSYKVYGNALTPSEIKNGTYGVNVPSSPPGQLFITEAATEEAKQFASWYALSLKPCWEPIILAQVQVDTNIKTNCKKYGTGAVNIDDCRIPDENKFPANILVSDNILGKCSKYFDLDAWAEKYNVLNEERIAADNHICISLKPTRKEKLLNNNHPTVKPLKLMSYLIHLLCPTAEQTPDNKPGIVLDPFVGSGTTCVAAILGGWRFLAAEMNPNYAEIAQIRIDDAYKYVENTTRELQQTLPFGNKDYTK